MVLTRLAPPLFTGLHKEDIQVCLVLNTTQCDQCIQTTVIAVSILEKGISDTCNVFLGKITF